MLGQRERRARALFDGIAAAYDLPAEVLSLGRYSRWRRALLGRLDVPRDARVLDVATGTGLIARGIEQRFGARVIGLDQSIGMLEASRARGARALVGGSADRLPFADATFDVVTFSYLFRYVPEPEATLRELVRVLRPGGILGSIEFGRPRSVVLRTGWRLYARLLFPALCFFLGPGWREVGAFLPRSIERWADDWPVPRQVDAWRAAGLDDVRVDTPTLGAGVVMVGWNRGQPA